MSVQIKKIISNLVRERKKIKTSDVIDILGGKISRQHISFIITEMVRKGELIRSGSYRYAVYTLPEYAFIFLKSIKKRLKNENLKEHEVLDSLVAQNPFLQHLNENVKSIFDYAFLEMLNNAIEHSKSKFIHVEAIKDDKNLRFVIDDFGIGAFKNIMQKRNLTSEIEAIQDLLKGKTTTAPKFHSGEGIFFTSKAADIFMLESHYYRLRIDNLINDVFIEELRSSKRGTKVLFTISLNSKKHLIDIFKEYQTDPKEYAFDKTKIEIKLYTMGTIYISRSQARRVLSALNRFRTVVLDFDKVPTVGQAFADEVFRVFKNAYPEIKIIPINMNEAVEFMVKRVRK